MEFDYSIMILNFKDNSIIKNFSVNIDNYFIIYLNLNYKTLIIDREQSK